MMKFFGLYIMFLLLLQSACHLDGEFYNDKYSPIPDSIWIHPVRGSEEHQLLSWEQSCVTRDPFWKSNTVSDDCPTKVSYNCFPTLIKVYKINDSEKNANALKQRYADVALCEITSEAAIPMLWEFDEVLSFDSGINSYLDSLYTHIDINTIVPNFKEELEGIKYTGNTFCGLSNDFKLYIIKMSKEYVLPENWNVYRSWLPGSLQHGYRAGVAINDHYIIYWSIAW